MQASNMYAPSEIVSVAKAAELMIVHENTVKNHILAGALRADASISAYGGGNAGRAYRVYVDSLPIAAQIKYWQESALAELGHGGSEFDTKGYEARTGEKGMAELLRRQKAALAAHGLRMRYEAHGWRGYNTALADLARELDVPRGTLYRWERGYAEQGLAGIARPVREDAGKSRAMCLLARDYVEFLLCDQQKPTQELVMESVQERSAELGADACENCPYRCSSSTRIDAMHDGQVLPVCSEAGRGMIAPQNRHAVNRAVKLVSDSVLAYARFGSRYWDAKYLQKVKRAKPERVNEVWFGDHHQCDLFVLDREGRAVRPWLTAWMDACSGAMVGWMLTLNPNSDTITESFIRAVAYTVDSPIHGLPQLNYIDNGKDYTSLRFEGGEFRECGIGKMNAEFCGKSILETLCVEVKHALPYWAWTKPIERMFGTLENRWMRRMPGWCGGSPDQRPQDLGREIKRLTERGELMMFETFAECFKRDVIDAYHGFAGEDGLTPMEIYTGRERARTDDPNWATLCLLKSQQVARVVSTQGVRLSGQHYQDIALGELVGKEVTVLYQRGYNASVSIMYGNRFICEAQPHEAVGMVERDTDKLGEIMQQKRTQRKGVTSHIATIAQHVRGVHREAYAEEIDTQRDQALARVGLLEAKKVEAAKVRVTKQRKARAGELDEGERRVQDMLNARGQRLLRMVEEG